MIIKFLVVIIMLYAPFLFCMQESLKKQLDDYKFQTFEQLAEDQVIALSSDNYINDPHKGYQALLILAQKTVQKYEPSLIIDYALALINEHNSSLDKEKISKEELCSALQLRDNQDNKLMHQGSPFAIARCLAHDNLRTLKEEKLS